MKYMLLLYSNPAETPEFTPEQQQAEMKAWFAFNAEAEKAGVLLNYDGLLPTSEARTVRVRDGKALTTDGPFAETREQLGGFYVLECADLDEATEWAAKVPSAKYGSIEVRPVYRQ